MAYFVSHRMTGDEPELPSDGWPDVLDELEQDDPEHPDVSLTHESGWCLGAYRDGALVWENVDDLDRPPMHMVPVDRDRVLELWGLLAAGDIEAVSRADWQPGYRS
jgi:hypothetical protein